MNSRDALAITNTELADEHDDQDGSADLLGFTRALAADDRRDGKQRFH